MMQYDFRKIQEKWQKYWTEHQIFKAEFPSKKPKYYVLDMFPYPSGAGLHVGHPLGYIASDIYARYKRHKGYNVLHPQGYDSFGLPAEQYAIKTGQHPAKTTQKNIATYRKQLDKIGLSLDWSREVRTSNPDYYKWTQWIFTELFESWYDISDNKAKPIKDLIYVFEYQGNEKIKAFSDRKTQIFTANDWKHFSNVQKQEILLQYRLAYLSETQVNWCPELATVLANDEVLNGLSKRGNHPVVRKKMKQWSMRITAYADRLLKDLEKLDWSLPLKDAQKNWIGKSKGAHVYFEVFSENEKNILEVFTTRPDTIFGVTFTVLAPEHLLIKKIVPKKNQEKVANYLQKTAQKSELERMANTQNISGVFTGAYAKHPFTQEKIPIWIADYVLAGYGSGAIMGVPCGDQRDYDFAKFFKLPIVNIFKNKDISKQAYAQKDVHLIASDFLNELSAQEAAEKMITILREKKKGHAKINYKIRDVVFSRQRYWGEPFPVYYKNGLPQMINKKYLPILLPEVQKYLPIKQGKPPLAHAKKWAWCEKTCQIVSNEKINNQNIFPMELNTMPGWAGSSWYFNRYMDPDNSENFAAVEKLKYWEQVDLYMGGSEHATGHLLYARFWQKFLYDRNFVFVDEFAKKLVNQGMILGNSAICYQLLFNTENHAVGSKIVNNQNLILISKGRCEEIPLLSHSFKKKLSDLDENLQKQIIEKAPWIKDEGIDLNDILVFKNNGFRVDISYVNSDDTFNFDKAKGDFRYLGFKKENMILEENGKFVLHREIEKMSKSKDNVINPDSICEEYGADALRLFEMFLGPLQQSKPWNTAGISGVFSFLKKLWNLYHSQKTFFVNQEKPDAEELKILHSTIKKITYDIEHFSFNTSVSTFMIAVNKLTAKKCSKKAILEPLLILLSPYAPHIAEELWEKLGNEKSIAYAKFPDFKEAFLKERSKAYPISFNGKVRFQLELSLDFEKEKIQEIVKKHPKTLEQLQGKPPQKIIVVLGKIVNVVF